MLYFPSSQPNVSKLALLCIRQGDPSFPLHKNKKTQNNLPCCDFHRWMLLWEPFPHLHPHTRPIQLHVSFQNILLPPHASVLSYQYRIMNSKNKVHKKGVDNGSRVCDMVLQCATWGLVVGFLLHQPPGHQHHLTMTFLTLSYRKMWRE